MGFGRTREDDQDLGQVMALIEPYAWAGHIGSQFGRCEIQATVKPAEPETTPQRLRLHLLERADEMIADLQGAGWPLLGKYTAEISTDSRGPGVTLANIMLTEPEQAYIKCDIRLTVVKVRLPSRSP